MRRLISLAVCFVIGTIVVVAQDNELDKAECVIVVPSISTMTNRKQIVATTVYNVYGLVDQGLFDERLYYRPNVGLLNLGG